MHMHAKYAICSNSQIDGIPRSALEFRMNLGQKFEIF